MVRVKGKGSKRCCCNDCGERPRGDAKECCYCACDELCVTIEMGDLGSYPFPCDDGCERVADLLCDCVKAQGAISWDDENCYWSGDIFCGSITVDLIVQIRKCPDGQCYICLESTCLGISGDCGGGGCEPLPGCGEYGADCEALEVSFHTLTQNLGDCGNANCNVDAVVTIKCQNVINPQPAAGIENAICRDCDCICECVCLTYCEAGCCETQLVCYDRANSRYQATFDGECPFDPQTITITLVPDENRCCRWELTASRGTVDGINPTTNCPRGGGTWTLNSIAATVDMECSVCDVCEIDSECCANDLPETIYARICSIPCGPWCIPLTFAGSTDFSSHWLSDEYTIQCTDAVEFACYDIKIMLEFECIPDGIGGTLWQIVVWCNDTAVQTATPTIQCDPFCASGTFALDLHEVDCGFAGPSGSCLDSYDVCISERAC